MLFQRFKMEELFPNVRTEFKKQVAFLVDMAAYQENLFEAVKMIKNFSDSCINEDEKDFIDFYIKLKLLQEQDNESNSDQW